MKHAIVWLSVVVVSVACVWILAAGDESSRNDPARQKFSAEESATIQTLARKIDSAAASVYLSKSDTFDTIRDILVAALGEFSKDGEYTPSEENEKPAQSDSAEWWEMQTLQLLITNLEIAASERYTNDPSSFSATVDTLTRVEKDISTLIKCSCPVGSPFCCCKRCRSQPCDWQQCS
jgi:hypothetical protein